LRSLRHWFADTLKQIEEKTKVQKVYLAAGVAVVAIVIVLYGFGAGLLCNLVGFVYPAYQSFKALDVDSNEDERLWLTYWVVYSCFTIVEGFLECFLFWVPFYYPIKLIALVFLFHPQTKGAMQIYDKVLKPTLKPYVGKLDAIGADVMNRVNNAQSNIQGVATGMVGKEAVKQATSVKAD
jgi:receptor expression-enhancing protein 5/6